MKVLKAVLCLLLALFTVLSPNLTARASTDGKKYARADTRNAYFCSEKDIEKALFAVPYTYCVEILAEDGDWYFVRYAQDAGIYRALTGFCRKEGLTKIEEPPRNIFLDYPVTITFSAGNPPDDSLPTLGKIDVTAAYYGVYYRGAVAYSYVLYDGEFGYVQGAHEDYPLNEIPADKPVTPSVDTEGNAKLITALVICGLAAAAIVVLFFTGKHKRIK